MHFIYSIQLLAGIMAAASGVLAVPADRPHSITRRAPSFATEDELDEQFLDGDEEVSVCTKAQQTTINEELSYAIQLADIARQVKITDPAYHAFMDRGVSSPPTADQVARFNLVQSHFEAAHKYLTDKSTTRIAMFCGVVKGKSECEEKTKAKTYNDRFDDGVPGILVCPVFWKQVEKRPGPLSTTVKGPDDKPFDMCQHPEMLRNAAHPSKTLLHEFMHLHLVAPKVPTDNSIIDCVYGAYLCGYLAEKSPKTALINADNYAYMAMSAYMNKHCAGKQTTMFYEKDKPTDGTNDPAKQPMGNKASFPRCQLPKEVAEFAGLPAEVRKGAAAPESE